MLRQNVSSILEYANVYGKRCKPTLLEIEIYLRMRYALVDVLNTISGIFALFDPLIWIWETTIDIFIYLRAGEP